MTTSIKKALKRKTNESYRNGSKARKLIITLHTTDVIGIREEGCRGEEILSNPRCLPIRHPQPPCA